MKDTVFEFWDKHLKHIHYLSVVNAMGKKKIVSPIEQILFLTVVSLDSAMLQLRENYKHIEIIPQYKMGRYKVDFLMKGDKDKLVVECDSQKWHETSEEHRRYEKERDRFIQASGYKIFRYTGKEIMDRAPLIAVEILHHVSSSDQTINIKMFKEMYKVEEGVDNGKN